MVRLSRTRASARSSAVSCTAANGGLAYCPSMSFDRRARTRGPGSSLPVVSCATPWAGRRPRSPSNVAHYPYLHNHHLCRRTSHPHITHRLLLFVLLNPCQVERSPEARAARSGVSVILRRRERLTKRRRSTIASEALGGRGARAWRPASPPSRRSSGSVTAQQDRSPFTGTSLRLDTDGVVVGLPSFEAGSRTHWLTHSAQLLFVKEAGRAIRSRGSR